MIVIEYENLKLQLITENDIELLRQWRNAPHVVGMMEYQEQISQQQQLDWFRSLDATQNLYFNIHFSDKPIGVVNLKNIDWAKKRAEAGVFLGEKDHLNTTTPVLAVMLLMRLAYDVLGIDVLEAKIAEINYNALGFNEALGYKKTDSLNKDFSVYECTKDNFYHNSSPLSKINRLFEKNSCVHVYVGKDSEWILKHLNVNDAIFQFHLL